MPNENDAIEQFLLIYDRKNRVQVEVREFGTDTESAVTAYRAAEQMYHDQPEMDIVLVGSDSLETVKRTHSTYFSSFSRQDLDDLVASLGI